MWGKKKREAKPGVISIVQHDQDSVYPDDKFDEKLTALMYKYRILHIDATLNLFPLLDDRSERSESERSENGSAEETKGKKDAPKF